MSYEWDEQKRQINIKKHGIDFIDIQNYLMVMLSLFLMSDSITVKPVLSLSAS